MLQSSDALVRIGRKFFHDRIPRCACVLVSALGEVDDFLRHEQRDLIGLIFQPKLVAAMDKCFAHRFNNIRLEGLLFQKWRNRHVSLAAAARSSKQNWIVTENSHSLIRRSGAGRASALQGRPLTGQCPQSRLYPIRFGRAGSGDRFWRRSRGTFHTLAHTRTAKKRPRPDLGYRRASRPRRARPAVRMSLEANNANGATFLTRHRPRAHRARSFVAMGHSRLLAHRSRCPLLPQKQPSAGYLRDKNAAVCRHAELNWQGFDSRRRQK
jgi:hypothetical protein